MPRHTSHHVRVLVVDLAPQNPAPPDVLLRRCDPHEQRRLRAVKLRVPHPERPEHAAAGADVERHPTALFDDRPQEGSSPGPRRRRTDFPVRTLTASRKLAAAGLIAAHLPVQRCPGGQAGLVCQKLSDGHTHRCSCCGRGRWPKPGGAIEAAGDGGRDCGVEVEVAFVDQHHGHLRRRHHLRQAGEVVHRLRLDVGAILGRTSAARTGARGPHPTYGPPEARPPEDAAGRRLLQ